jgi:hypothetical protein
MLHRVAVRERVVVLFAHVCVIVTVGGSRLTLGTEDNVLYKTITYSSNISISRRETSVDGKAESLQNVTGGTPGIAFGGCIRVSHQCMRLIEKYSHQQKQCHPMIAGTVDLSLSANDVLNGTIMDLSRCLNQVLQVDPVKALRTRASRRGITAHLVVDG